MWLDSLYPPISLEHDWYMWKFAYLEYAEKLCLSIRERLVDITPQQKKEFLRLVVERIWVDKSNNLEIEVVIPKLEKQAENVICETPLSLKGKGEISGEEGLRPSWTPRFPAIFAEKGWLPENRGTVF